MEEVFGFIKVDKGVPIPQRYPFESMEVGDSFVIPSDVKRTTVTVACKRYGQKQNKRFIVRKMEDGVYRCWRVL